eukprot:5918878-Lingulodinium_polyedra.AAC.1
MLGRRDAGSPAAAQTRPQRASARDGLRNVAGMQAAHWRLGTGRSAVRTGRQACGRSLRTRRAGRSAAT